MFFYTLIALQLTNDTRSPTANLDGAYAVGYFLCGIAVFATIACLVVAVKLKKINDINDQKKINTLL